MSYTTLFNNVRSGSVAGSNGLTPDQIDQLIGPNGAIEHSSTAKQDLITWQAITRDRAANILFDSSVPYAQYDPDNTIRLNPDYFGTGAFSVSLWLYILGHEAAHAVGRNFVNSGPVEGCVENLNEEAAAFGAGFRAVWEANPLPAPPSRVSRPTVPAITLPPLSPVIVAPSSAPAG